MAEQPFIISPAGFIADYNFTVPSPFTGKTQAPYTVTVPLPGVVASMRTTGAQPISNLGGQQGTLEVRCTTGTAPGASQALAFLTNSLTAPTLFLGVALDASNRALAFVTDNAGNIVARWAPSGSVVAVGTPRVVTLVWNYAAAVDTTHFCKLLVNGVTATGSWAVDATATWPYFTPSALLVGNTGTTTFQSMQQLPADAVITKVQVGTKTT